MYAEAPEETMKLKFKCLELAMRYNEARVQSTKSYYMHPNEIGELAEEFFNYSTIEGYCINVDNHYLGHYDISRKPNVSSGIHPNLKEDTVGLEGDK